MLLVATFNLPLLLEFCRRGAAERRMSVPRATHAGVRVVMPVTPLSMHVHMNRTVHALDEEARSADRLRARAVTAQNQHRSGSMTICMNLQSREMVDQVHDSESREYASALRRWNARNQSNAQAMIQSGNNQSEIPTTELQRREEKRV